VTQGGQNIDQQWGLIESYHEENFHRDGPQSERLEPRTLYVSWGHPSVVVHFHWTHRLGGV
jgi:hypothetical protein